MEEIFVGSKELQINDELNEAAFSVYFYYPTHEPSLPVSFGSLALKVCPDGKLVSGKFPLVIISHGNGGSPLIYHTISMYLARNGFIVAMPEHYGNNRNNNELGFTVKNLQLRPRHISLTIDRHQITPKQWTEDVLLA